MAKAVGPVFDPLEPRLLLAADLVVDAVTGTADFYSVGNFLHAVAHIANDGTFLSSTGSFNLDFYLSRVGGAQKYKFIESGFVLNILAGFSTTDEINLPGWVIPDDVPQGSYRVTVFLDTGNDVAEENENNNVGASPTFTIGRPDLDVTLVEVDRTNYGRGQFLNATATIENIGAGGTFAQSPFGFNLSFFLGAANATSDAQRKLFPIEDGLISFLNPGQTATDIINAPGWAIPSNVPNGDYRVWVLADSGDDIAEISEGNNFGSSEVIRIGIPDLVIDEVTLDQSVYAYNEILTAVATIRNDGPGSTLQESPLGFNVSFYLGAVNATTDAQRMQVDLQQAFVAFLQGGQSTTDNLNKLILPTFQPGEYRLWVKADSNDNVNESNENNNWGSSDVLTIQGARWEDEDGNLLGDEILEATPVYLAVYTEQVGGGTNIPVNIFEDDVLGNDLVESVTLKHVSTPGGHKWQRRWIPYRTSDLVFNAGSTPEYFFRVDNSDHLPGLFDASSNVTINPRDTSDEFGVLLVEHTEGAGVPLILVHGNNSDTDSSYDLYRWKHFLNWIESHPDDFAEFDVWLWKHDTSQPVGFSGALPGNVPATTPPEEERSQAVRLSEFVYGDGAGELAFGQAGSRYTDPTTRIALIAHSQGGMVSRSFMNIFNPDRGHHQGEDVGVLVTLGTPHHGSPFGVEDWVAVLWSQLFGTGAAAESSFAKARTALLGQQDGDINLAWDNMDGVVIEAVESFDGSDHVLTPRDTNRVSTFTDPLFLYRDQLKTAHGTLAALNENERFIHKLVAVGAYDSDLSDNITPLELLATLLADGAISDHEKLDAVANLMSLMNGPALGNSNPSSYVANDGLVPLQSALMLNLPSTGVSVATIDANLDVTTLDGVIDLLTPRDMFNLYFSSGEHGIGDHEDILSTTNDDYWSPITTYLRSVLETTAPRVAAIDPANTATIDPAVLNARGYIDVTFADPGVSSTIDPTTILDAALEFRLVGPAARNVIVSGAPQRLGGDGLTYRYFFTGDFDPAPGTPGSSGAVSVEFIEGGFADDAGNESAAQSFAFNLAGAVLPQRVGYAVSDSGDHFGLVDLDTGAFHLVGQLRSADGLTLFTDVENLAIDPTSGALYGVDSGTLITIDPTTAIVTVIGDTGLADVDALTFNPAGELFAVDAVPATNPGELFQIDKATAGATRLTALLMPVPDELVAMGAIDPQLDGIAFDPASAEPRLIAAYSSYGSMSFIVEVDLATGQILNIGAAGVDDIEDIAFGQDGLLYGSLGDTGAIHGQRSGSLEGLVAIDTVTGAATPIGSFGTPLVNSRWDVEGLAIPAAPVPVEDSESTSFIQTFIAQPGEETPLFALAVSATIEPESADAAPAAAEAEAPAVKLIPRVRLGPISVAIGEPKLDAAASAYRFTIHYSGAAGVDPRSLGARHLRISASGLAPDAAVIDTRVEDDGSVTATYAIAAPPKLLAAAAAAMPALRIDLLANTVRDRFGRPARQSRTIASVFSLTPPLFSVERSLEEIGSAL